MDCKLITYTHKYINPFEPDEESIDIDDIAHALSLICRGNGHVKTFYSVAQHSIACAEHAINRGCSERIVLAALLHDSAECYLCDVPRPVKKNLPLYIQTEQNFLKVLFRKFLRNPLTEEGKETVRMIDDMLLERDMIYLFESDGACPDMPENGEYAFVPFQEVENRFKDLFHIYYRRIQEKERQS